MDITCIADLHGYYPELPGGDLLIVAGDLTERDEFKQYIKFNAWLLKQKYRKKILIAGNHDKWIEKAPMLKETFYDCEYLCDSGTEFEGLKIWGSPWTKTLSGMNQKCKAFTCDTEEELAEKFHSIPDVDILVTHSPPYGIFDAVIRNPNDIPKSMGSEFLLNKITGRTNLKVHIFGHIHEHGGKSRCLGTTKFINASHVNERYEPVNKPVRIVL